MTGGLSEDDVVAPADDWEQEERPRRRIVDDLGYPDWVDMVTARARRHPEDARRVCWGCVHDRGLKRFVRWAAVARSCDFCGRRSPVDFAACLDELARFVEGCLRADYDQPENVLFYDAESDTGWAGDVWDNRELLEDAVWAEERVVEALSALSTRICSGVKATRPCSCRRIICGSVGKPVGMTLQSLRGTVLPLSWEEQRTLFGMRP